MPASRCNPREHQFGRRASIGSMRTPMRCRSTCGSDDSSQFGNRTTGAVAYGYRFVAGLARDGELLEPRSRRRRSTTCISRISPIPICGRRRSRNVEVAIYCARRQGRDVRWDAHAVAYHNRVRDLIVFQCDADFNCAPQNVADATLEGVTLTGQARMARHDGQRIRRHRSRRATTDPGTLLPRRARRHGVVALSQPYGRAMFGAEVVASSERFDDAENLRRWRLFDRQPRPLEWSRRRADDCFCPRRQRVQPQLRACGRLCAPAARACSQASDGEYETACTQRFAPDFAAQLAESDAMLALAALVATATHAQGTVVDDTGAAVTMPAPARRIVTLAPHADRARVRCGRGLGDRRRHQGHRLSGGREGVAGDRRRQCARSRAHRRAAAGPDRHVAVDDTGAGDVAARSRHRRVSSRRAHRGWHRPATSSESASSRELAARPLRRRCAAYAHRGAGAACAVARRCACSTRCRTYRCSRSAATISISQAITDVRRSQRVRGR